MSRRRYISTDISTDIKTAELAEYGTLPLLLYTWAIPHMDDWGRMTGDARQFKLLVCPALDVSSKEVDESLTKIAKVGLWQRYEIDGKQYIGIHEDSWFKHQSYINKAKRGDDTGSNYPKMALITEEHRVIPQNAVSPSPSLSFSPSPSKISSGSNSDKNVFGIYQSEIGELTDYIAEELVTLELEYSEEWVKQAIKTAVMQDVKKMSYIKGALKKWKLLNVPDPWNHEKPDNVTPFPKGGQSNAKHGTGHGGYTDEQLNTMFTVR